MENKTMERTLRSRVTAGETLAPIGFRKNGRAIFPIVGADPTDPSNQGNGLVLNHPQSVNRLREITTEMERLAELNEPTTEDETYFGELRDEFKSTDLHRKKLERQAQLAEIRNAGQNLGGFRLEAGARRAGAGDALNPNKFDADPFTDPQSVEDFRGRDPWNLGEMRTFGRQPEEVRSELNARALSALERVRGTSDEIRQAGTQILERQDDQEGTIAKLILATTSPAYIRAFAKEARFEGNMLTAEEQAAVANTRSLMRAMSLTGSGGGYLIPFQLDPTVIVTANGSNNDIRRVARQVVATGTTWNGVSAGLVSWSWDAEATEVSDDSPTFAQPSVQTYTARGFVPISIEAAADEQNVASTVGELLAGGRDVLEAAAFINGTGTAQPWGIVAALTGTASEIASTTADTLAVGDIYSLWGTLPTRYRRNANWLANTLIYNRIRQFDTAGGSALWTTIGNGQVPDLLGGSPLESEDMTGVITGSANNRIAVVGDFSNYVIADRIGLTVEFIPHLFGTTNGRPKGQRGWFAYYRTGADSVNDAAFRMLNA
jgi:HK97 family phage major capsid protein